MISSLHELNETINAVVNRIVEYGTDNTSSGQRYIGHNEVADLISEEDYLQYFDLIESELAGREEILDLDVDGHDFDCVFGLAWCKNYEWADGDEAIFGCSFDEWEQNFKPEPISKPLSMSRLAEIGEAAISYVLETSDMAIDDLTESLGLSMQELSQLGIYEPDKVEHFTYQVMNVQKEMVSYYPDFDAALAGYARLGNSENKTLSVLVPEGMAPEGAVHILQQQNGKDVLCNTRTDLPHIKEVRDQFADTEVEQAFKKAREFCEKAEKPILFHVYGADPNDPDARLEFDSFEAALAHYSFLGPSEDNALAYMRKDKEAGRMKGGIVIQYDEYRKSDVLCAITDEALKDPNVALAYAKATLHFYPFDEKAWNMRDKAEKELGIAEREVDMSQDLQVGKWRVHIIPPGGHYGLHNQVINETRESLVEFNDMSQDKSKFPHGQMVTRYHASTLLEDNGWPNSFKNGLCLDASIPSWKVTGPEMAEIIKYIKEQTSVHNKRPALDAQISSAKAQQQTAPHKEFNSEDRER